MLFSTNRGLCSNVSGGLFCKPLIVLVDEADAGLFNRQQLSVAVRFETASGIVGALGLVFGHQRNGIKGDAGRV